MLLLFLLSLSVLMLLLLFLLVNYIVETLFRQFITVITVNIIASVNGTNINVIKNGFLFFVIIGVGNGGGGG